MFGHASLETLTSYLYTVYHNPPKRKNLEGKYDCYSRVDGQLRLVITRSRAAKDLRRPFKVLQSNGKSKQMARSISTVEPQNCSSYQLPSAESIISSGASASKQLARTSSFLRHPCFENMFKCWRIRGLSVRNCEPIVLFTHTPRRT